LDRTKEKEREVEMGENFPGESEDVMGGTKVSTSLRTYPSEEEAKGGYDNRRPNKCS